MIAAVLLAAQAAYWSPPPTMPKRAYPLILIVARVAEQQGDRDWIARMAAQIDAESAWKPDAESPYAVGLAQFTPATAIDMNERCRSLAGLSDWHRPEWQVQAQHCYLKALTRYCREAKDDECWRVRWASYNAGPGWIRRERNASKNANEWSEWSTTCLRAEWACSETLNYVRRIERLLRFYE